jgi:hypothetical protein
MKNIATSGGRLFSASVEGGPTTVKDVMVAGHVYLSALEDQFKTSQQLLACHRAWTEQLLRSPGEMADDQNERVKQWITAHDRADHAARKWLSAPSSQSFVLRLTVG